jgi:hypothetical protein
VRMKKWPNVALLTAFLCLAGSNGRAAEPAAALVLERAIALKGVSGRIDHLAVDLGRKRLFVAELGNGTVDVIDLTAGAVIHRIEGLKEPQGVAYAPGADVLAVASAGDGSVRLFRGTELSPAGTIDLHDDADNVRLDTRTGKQFGGGLWERRPGRDRSGQVFPLKPHSTAGSSREFSAGPRSAAPSSTCRVRTRSPSSICRPIGKYRVGGCLNFAQTFRWHSMLRAQLPWWFSVIPRASSPSM